LSSGDLVLIEERIYGEFQNFIFVDGTSHDKCPELLIELIHFSYHNYARYVPKIPLLGT
jgi:hypothetical protein